VHTHPRQGAPKAAPIKSDDHDAGDMNTLAKRIHNVTPKDVRLTLDGGESVTLEMRSAEFFQESFQAEGIAEGTTYRMVTDGEDDPLVVARETESGWEVLGEVESVEAA
jgi:hypothetical protein